MPIRCSCITKQLCIFAYLFYSLIDATHKDVDVLLLLSNSSYYVAYYDDEVDKVNQYQRLSLEALEKIEIGPEPTLFGKPKFSCMRLHYKYNETSGYFHTLRAVMRNPEEDGKDTLQCIAEMLRITKQAMGLDVPIIEKKLESWCHAVCSFNN
uniref:Inositol polyphosphate-5-phosphatase F n=1 Tax=Terrapene triunguis TaxID=2587831 RepID=A0A674K068_9SAUR